MNKIKNNKVNFRPRFKPIKKYVKVIKFSKYLQNLKVKTFTYSFILQGKK